MFRTACAWFSSLLLSWNLLNFEQVAPEFYFTLVVQLLSRVWLFVTPSIAALQPSLSFTISWSLLKLMSMESVMTSNHLVLCFPLLLLPASFPSTMVFLMSWLFASGGQRVGAWASVLVLPMNIQVWFPLGLTGLISLLSKGLSRVFSTTTLWKHQFFGAQPSLWSVRWQLFCQLSRRWPTASGAGNARESYFKEELL